MGGLFIKMRIWDIDPGFLNQNSLLGEHRELHGLISIHINNKKGYAKHPETLRWKNALTGLFIRHESLVTEMELRGFNHNSPLDAPAQKPGWPKRFIDTPYTQFSLLAEKYKTRPQGRIPLPKNRYQLWASHKYSVMARDPERYRSIGPEVAAGRISMEDLSLELVQILRQPPEAGRLTNALDHMWGYVAESRFSPRNLDQTALLREIQNRTTAENIRYLIQSTALGELGVWVEKG
jgi:hypothetical protein